MSADKKFGWIYFYFFVYIGSVMTGVTTYVSNPRVYFFGKKTLIFGPHFTHILPINVSVNSSNRFYFLQRIGYRNGANIACMPNLIAFIKILEKFFVKIIMCVGKECDALHKKLSRFCAGQFYRIFFFETT